MAATGQYRSTSASLSLGDRAAAVENQAKRMCTRTTLPVADERICTRSQS
jgi:hypothetical protein